MLPTVDMSRCGWLLPRAAVKEAVRCGSCGLSASSHRPPLGSGCWDTSTVKQARCVLSALAPVCVSADYSSQRDRPPHEYETAGVGRACHPGPWALPLGPAGTRRSAASELSTTKNFIQRSRKFTRLIGNTFFFMDYRYIHFQLDLLIIRSFEGFRKSMIGYKC